MQHRRVCAAFSPSSLQQRPPSLPSLSAAIPHRPSVPFCCRPFVLSPTLVCHALSANTFNTFRLLLPRCRHPLPFVTALLSFSRPSSPLVCHILPVTATARPSRLLCHRLQSVTLSLPPPLCLCPFPSTTTSLPSPSVISTSCLSSLRHPYSSVTLSPPQPVPAVHA